MVELWRPRRWMSGLMPKGGLKAPGDLDEPAVPSCRQSGVVVHLQIEACCSKTEFDADCKRGMLEEAHIPHRRPQTDRDLSIVHTGLKASVQERNREAKAAAHHVTSPEYSTSFEPESNYPISLRNCGFPYPL